jgi:NADH-quinone oxidoreductase subunit G
VCAARFEKLTGQSLANPDFYQVRGEAGVRFADLSVHDTRLRLAVVHGLKNARILAEKVRRGEHALDLIEVMACPGGCVGGAGQPVSRGAAARQSRARGLYDADKHLELHKSQENPFVTGCYQRHLGEVGGHEAHQLLHTRYENRRSPAPSEPPTHGTL